VGRIALAIVTALAFFTRFYKLHHPDEVVFDEVHFGKFASYVLYPPTRSGLTRVVFATALLFRCASSDGEDFVRIARVVDWLRRTLFV
jgi:hypothetical protein